jgi:hypothetical protein
MKRVSINYENEMVQFFVVSRESITTMLIEHLASRRGCVPAVMFSSGVSTAFGSASLFFIYSMSQHAYKLS